jgi:hypothetical protein
MTIENTLDNEERILFFNVDKNRVVPKEVTSHVVLEVLKQVSFYSENTLPCIKDSNPNDSRYMTMKAYIDNLRWLCRNGLIPESRANENTTVRRNYSFLRPNKVLTHNQALFTLLGLNTLRLDQSLHGMETLNSSKPKGQHMGLSLLEDAIWDTPQNFELRSCSYFENGKITSEKLEIFATKDNIFFSDNWKMNKHLQEVNGGSILTQNYRPKTEKKKKCIEVLEEEWNYNDNNKGSMKKEKVYWVKEQLKERHGIEDTEENLTRHHVS